MPGVVVDVAHLTLHYTPQSPVGRQCIHVVNSPYLPLIEIMSPTPGTVTLAFLLTLLLQTAMPCHAIRCTAHGQW